MDKNKLSSLAEELVNAKAQAAFSESEAKIKKGKTGLIVFGAIFLFFLINGLTIGVLHFSISEGEESVDFHDVVGQYVLYVALGIAVVALLFVWGYSSLYKEGKKEKAEAEALLKR
jgi:hypothetical protein